MFLRSVVQFVRSEAFVPSMQGNVNFETFHEQCSRMGRTGCWIGELGPDRTLFTTKVKHVMQTCAPFGIYTDTCEHITSFLLHTYCIASKVDVDLAMLRLFERIGGGFRDLCHNLIAIEVQAMRGVDFSAISKQLLGVQGPTYVATEEWQYSLASVDDRLTRVDRGLAYCAGMNLATLEKKLNKTTQDTTRLQKAARTKIHNNSRQGPTRHHTKTRSTHNKATRNKTQH